jgi:preprotein translocase SecE subunit
MSLVQRGREFLKEVQVEFLKVSWLSRGDLQAQTAVVLIAVIVISLFIGVVDRILTAGLNLVLR